MGGFMARRSLVAGDRVLILAGEYAGETAAVAGLEPTSANGYTAPRYRLRRTGPPFDPLGTFEAPVLRGLVGLTGPLAARIGRAVALAEPPPASFGELMRRAEKILPPDWDLEISRLGTNEGKFRYRAYAADPTCTDDLISYGLTMLESVRELVASLEQRFGSSAT